MSAGSAPTGSTCVKTKGGRFLSLSGLPLIKSNYSRHICTELFNIFIIFLFKFLLQNATRDAVRDTERSLFTGLGKYKSAFDVIINH